MRGPSRKHDAWALSSVVFLQFLSDGMADPASYGNHERDVEQVSSTTLNFCPSFFQEKK